MNDEEYIVDLTPHVKHLRTIHFSLVVTCCGLIAVFFYGSHDLREARDDIETIETLVSDWNASWLQDHIETRLNQRVVAPDWFSSGLTVTIGEGALNGSELSFSMSGPRWALLERERLRRFERSGEELSLLPPVDMKGFKELWDALLHADVVLAVSPTSPAPATARVFTLEKAAHGMTDSGVPFVVHKEPVETRGEVRLGVEADRKNGRADELRLVHEGNVAGILSEMVKMRMPPNLINEVMPALLPNNGKLTFCSHRRAVRNGHQVLVVLEVEKPVKVEIQPLFWLKEMAGTRWQLVEFDTAFTKRLPYIKHLEELKLSELRLVLDGQLEKSGQPVALWGWRVDSKALGVFGIWLVVAIQLYFLVHLRELMWRMKKGALLDEPWLGLYRQFLSSKLVYYFSIAVVPIWFALFSGCLEYKSPHLGFASIFRFVGVAGSLVLSGYICVYSRGFRQQVGECLNIPVTEE